MTETMLTKMADALGHADGAGLSYEDMARAALMAIREPSEGVLAAGHGHHWGTDRGEPVEMEIENCGDIFTAMIDAILNGEA